MSSLFLIGSTLLTAGAQAQQANENYAASMANAAAAEAEAERVRHAAAIDAEKETERGERTLGAALVAAASSGFAVSGSALDVLADLSSQHRFNTRELIYGGELERQRLLFQAAQMRRSGRAALTQGRLGALATLMRGGYRLTSLDSGGG